MSENIITAINTAANHTNDVIERNSLSESAQAERLSLENLNATRDEGAEGRDTTEQFGFQELNSIERHGDAAVSQTVASAADTRSEIERFGFQNLGSTQHASDLGITATNAARSASEAYGYRNVIATKDAEKEILEAICGSNAGMSAVAREILMQAAGNAKDLLLQACGDTASIKSQSASEFKDILLQNATNAAAVAVQNTLNAKDAEISAVSNAKDAALVAAVNFEKLFGQADRNTAALQASIAECCCENKSLIRETSSHTDALIRALDEGRVKEELLTARFKILALENKIPAVAVAA